MSTERAIDVAAETATNRRYLEALRKRLDRPIEVTISTNQKWVNDLPALGGARWS